MGGKTPLPDAQGIEAEILFCRPRQKRLERKARFPAASRPEMRPKQADKTPLRLYPIARAPLDIFFSS
jgi:hypothetical protein